MFLFSYQYQGVSSLGIAVEMQPRIFWFSVLDQLKQLKVLKEKSKCTGKRNLLQRTIAKVEVGLCLHHVAKLRITSTIEHHTESPRPGFKPRTSLPCDGSVPMCHPQVKKLYYLLDLKSRVSSSEDWFSQRAAREISMKHHTIFLNIFNLKVTVEDYLVWLDAPGPLKSNETDIYGTIDFPNLNYQTTFGDIRRLKSNDKVKWEGTTKLPSLVDMINLSCSNYTLWDSIWISDNIVSVFGHLVAVIHCMSAWWQLSYINEVRQACCSMRRKVEAAELTAVRVRVLYGSLQQSVWF